MTSLRGTGDRQKLACCAQRHDVRRHSGSDRIEACRGPLSERYEQGGVVQRKATSDHFRTSVIPVRRDPDPMVKVKNSDVRPACAGDVNVIDPSRRKVALPALRAD